MISESQICAYFRSSQTDNWILLREEGGHRQKYKFLIWKTLQYEIGR